MRTCNICGEVKALTEYYVQQSKATGRLWYMRRCKPCNYARQKESELRRLGPEGLRERQRGHNANRPEEKKLNNRLRSRYGITLADYHALLESQDYCCAICTDRLDETGGRLYVDHCHDTGRVRGLLCNACNRSIGGLRDNPELLRRAADYVEAQGVPLAQEHPEWRARYGFLLKPAGPVRRYAEDGAA